MTVLPGKTLDVGVIAVPALFKNSSNAAVKLTGTAALRPT